ncbi:hypothetical protein Hanom_Chr04g00289621 [Helianthus anomalus]
MVETTTASRTATSTPTAASVLAFTFSSCCMDARSLSTSTFLSSVLSAARAFLFSSKTI